MDLSLAVKRAVFAPATLLTLSPLGLLFAQTLFRTEDPEVARLAGEELVRSPRRVLALTAHPDDLEFFAGGTLRRLVLGGSEVIAVVMTDGEKRGNRPNQAQWRREEQLRAAELQGYRHVEFIGLPDFGLPEDPRLERVVGDWIRQARPDVVLAFDPKELVPRMANRDHKALGRTVADAVRPLAGSGLRVYFYGTHCANTLVDITGVMEDKIRAVRCHDTQLVYLSHAGYAALARQMARAAGGQAQCRYGEVLFRLL